jgi:hypothetical protein
MNSVQWARLSRDMDCGLRRGAWYRTIAVGSAEVALAVHGKTRSISRNALEIVSTKPTRWTVVANAGNATLIPARWARGYAVCPNCRMRQLPMGRPQLLRCDGCNGLFEVAWDEPYLSRFGDSDQLPRM